MQADFCYCNPFSTERCYECLLTLTVPGRLQSIRVFIKTFLGYLHPLEPSHRDGTERHNETFMMRTRKDVDTIPQAGYI